EAWATKEVQVTIITVGNKIPQLKQFAEAIMKIEHVKSVFHNVTEIENKKMWGFHTEKLLGQDKITEKLLDKEFKLSPEAFFQLNPEQTKNLYELALKNLDLTPDDTLIDAYSGVGTIGILAADRVKKVIGMETIPEAVEDAKQNVKLNNVKNADYLVGKA